jgi:hypothetical protein
MWGRALISERGGEGTKPGLELGPDSHPHMLVLVSEEHEC